MAVVQGSLKDSGSFRISIAQICLLLHSRDTFLSISDSYVARSSVWVIISEASANRIIRSLNLTGFSQ